MKNSINFSFLNNAAQFRTANPILNAILLLLILVAIPVILVLGIVTLVAFAIIAKVRAFNNTNAAPGKDKHNIHFDKHRSAKSDDGFADYVIVDEKIGN